MTEEEIANCKTKCKAEEKNALLNTCQNVKKKTKNVPRRKWLIAKPKVKNAVPRKNNLLAN